MQSATDYLTAQAAGAKSRLRRNLRGLGEDLVEPLNLRPVIRRHPWSSVGAAAVTGLLAGLGLGKRRARTSPAPAPATKAVHPLLAQVHQRFMRLVRSAFGALIVTNLRRESPTAAADPTASPVSTNGHIPHA